ncbi:hypothetical protein ACFL35_11445, partial [Candidatus Riflebacteria bacterium]
MEASETVIYKSKKLFDNRTTFLTLFLLVCFSVQFYFMCGSRSIKKKTVSPNSDLIIRVVSDLKARNLFKEGARLLEGYVLNSDELPQASLVFSLAELYEKGKEFEKALSMYYFSLKLNPAGDLEKEIQKNIVFCLEKLGKFYDSESTLKESARVDISKKKDPKDLLIARIFGKSFYFSDFKKLFDSLPENIRSQLTRPEQKLQLLKSHLSNEVLANKAKKLKIQESDEFKEQLNRF